MSKKVHETTPWGLSLAVEAANSLTAQWCTRCGDGDFVLSGAGLWPLLALLASAADEQAGAELEGVVGWRASGAMRAALELIDILRTGESTTAALGVWTRDGIPLHDDWASQLPEGVIGTLTDQAALDRWAAEGTDGLIEKFPLQLNPGILLVLASALATRVKWVEPFDSRPRNGDHWEPGEPDQQWLSRNTHDLYRAAVIDRSVTRVVVEGDGDVDVHLLLGDLEPAEVLSTGLRALAGDALPIHADISDRDGPGLKVRRVRSAYPRDVLRVELPSFEIKSRHNLMREADLFGLRSLSDPGVSHLPLLSPVPLFVSQGVQDVLARFFAEGFEAAAVTAFGIALGGLPPEDRYEVKYVNVTFDRPFGFLAVHRPSGLAVVAGWVSSPFQGEAR